MAEASQSRGRRRRTWPSRAPDLPEFQRLMRTGVASGNRKLGLMAEVSRNDFRHLTDGEIAAIHAYLKERAARMP